MHKTLDWVFVVLGLIWLATPWVLVPPRLEEMGKGPAQRQSARGRHRTRAIRLYRVTGRVNE